MTMARLDARQRNYASARQKTTVIDNQYWNNVIGLVVGAVILLVSIALSVVAGISSWFAPDPNAVIVMVLIAMAATHLTTAALNIRHRIS